MRGIPAGPIESWVLRHQGTFIVALVVVVAALVPLSIYLLVDETKQGRKLRGVDVAGPCRAYGIQNDECQRQARKIFAACYVQQEECWDKYGLPRKRLPDRVVARGGDALQQPNHSAPQQPGPQHGGHGKEGSPAAPAPQPAPPSVPSAPPPSEPVAPPAQAPPDKSALEEVVGVVEDLPCSLPVELCP